MTDKFILKTDGPVAELILNHPQRRNALNLEMWAAIPALIAKAEASAARALIIHGGAVGHFAAGADISEFPTKWGTRETAGDAAQKLADATRAIEHCKLPTIAAVEKSCMGAGLSLATAADLRVIADGAKIGLPPAKLGASYPYEDLRRLVDLIGIAPTRDLILTARVVAADEAALIGLASRRCSAGEALTTARALAAQMVPLSQWSQAAAKTQLTKIAAGQRTETPDMRALQVEGFLNDDFKEGYSAFLEKRKPRFD
jgi:enoyl-CoA hydratase/carnithine racemase